MIELASVLAGPAVGMFFAELGAEVIKIEPPTGDAMRNMSRPPKIDGPLASYDFQFDVDNRGKRSIVANFREESDLERVKALAKDADVIIENFKTGSLDKFGLDYASLSAGNPRLVYCSISAFGQSGALAHHPAHDMAVQALAGFLAVNDGADGAPVVPGAASADLASGLTALSGVLMALLGRERTGEGAYIDCAMFDSLLPWCAHTAGSAIAGGESPVSQSQRSLGGAGFYQIYETSDGKHVALGGREIKFAQNLLDALGRLALLPIAEAPAGEQGELIAFLKETFAAKSRDEWVQWFADKDVAFSPVLNFREAFDEPHIAQRGLLVEAEGGGNHIAPAIRFAGEDWRPAKVPGKGEHGV